MPTSFVSLTVELAAKPLTLNGLPLSSLGPLPQLAHAFFLSYALLIASSQGTISSTVKTDWQELDQRTRAGSRLISSVKVFQKDGVDMLFLTFPDEGCLLQKGGFNF